jgi:hypothetical protein
MLTPYPPSLPLDSVKLVVAKIRGTADPSVSMADLIHAGWEVTGFAFSQTVGNPGAVVPATFGAASSEHCTPEEVARHLEGCTKKTMQLSIPWSTIALTLGELVLTWLKKQYPS